MVKLENFSLFLGCLGNGITVCNKAVMEHGDFKHIAYISDSGQIRWYIENPEKYVPEKDMKTIDIYAGLYRTDFLEKRSRMPLLKRYEDVLDHLPMKEFLFVIGHKDWDLEHRVKYGEEILYGI